MWPSKGGALEGWGPQGWCPKGGAQKGGAQKGGAPKGGALQGGGRKISRFFVPRPLFSFFFPSLGVFNVAFWWILKRSGPEMCTFGVLRESPNVHILLKHQQNATEGPLQFLRRRHVSHCVLAHDPCPCTNKRGMHGQGKGR